MCNFWCNTYESRERNMKKIFKALLAYLKDWKNLLTHTIIGVSILLIALFMPVHPLLRVLFFVLVVAANIIRMRYQKKKSGNRE